MPIQTLQDVYIDEELLKALLSKLFGRGRYKMQFKHNQWSIKAPRFLTDAEIESVEQPGQS